MIIGGGVQTGYVRCNLNGVGSYFNAHSPISFGSPTIVSFADGPASPDICEIEPVPYEVRFLVRREANVPSLTVQALGDRLFKTQSAINVRLAVPGSDVEISVVVEARSRYITTGDLQTALYTALYAPPPESLVSTPEPASMEAFRKRIGQLNGQGSPSLIDFYPPNHADDSCLVLVLKPLDGQLGEAIEYEAAWSNA